MQQKKKRRIINFRSFLLIAVCVILAILFVRVDFMIEGLGLALLALLILILLSITIFCIFKKVPTYKTATFILAIILSATGGIHFYFNVRNEKFVCSDSLHFVSGKVDDVDQSRHRIIIKNLYINGNSEDGRMLLMIDFEIEEYLYALSVGDYIIFKARLRSNPFLRSNGTINNHTRRTQIRYTIFEVYNDVIAINPGRADFFQSISEHMRHNLNLAMGTEYGAVAFGMITGDRSAIAPEIREAYSASGLMHILAVSGLHLGFVSLALMKLLKWLRLKKGQANAVIILVIWFYVLFVGFAPSIARAAIMVTIFIISHTFSGRYDPLNSLGMAVTGILVFAPFFLFDVGFLFSVGAVLGITCFSRPIRTGLRRIRLPDFIASKLSVSISAQLGIIPAMIYFFESIQIYSIFINLLVNPLISIGFIAIFITLILSMIFRPLIVLLEFSGIFIAAIDAVALAGSSLPNALFFVLPIFGGLLFLCYLLYFGASRFLMLSKSSKIKAIKATIFLSIASVFLGLSIPLTRSFDGDNFIVPVASVRDVTSVVRHNNRTYVIGDLRSFNALDDTLRRLNIRQIDAVFLTELTSAQIVPLTRLSRRYGFNVALVYEGGFEPTALTGLAQRGVTNVTIFEAGYSIASDMLPIVVGNRNLGFELLTQNGSIIFTGSRTWYTRLPNEVLYRSFVIRSNSFLGYFDDRIFLTNFATNRFLEEDIEPFKQITPTSYNKYLFEFNTGRTLAFNR
ncbi:MAG: ComEC/Rec2 family competence protein [Firmicutes bacterium]|nr:ComEC/Rec2 family competence protein [Bacillota bacterium]